MKEIKEIQKIDETPVDKDGTVFLGMTKGGLHLALKKGKKIEILETASHPGILKYKLKKRGYNILQKSLTENIIAEQIDFVNSPKGINIYWSIKNGEDCVLVENLNNGKTFELPVSALNKSETNLPTPILDAMEYINAQRQC